MSLIDYPGRITSIVFVTGCNMRCPFCYTSDLVLKNYKNLKIYPEEEILEKLKESRKFVEAVDITGGEPTLQEGLEGFIRKCREIGLLVKLDTNGSNPGILEDFLKKGIIDYVAMDIKTEMEPRKYQKALGVSDENILTNVRKSMEILMGSGIDYEFRTTVVPSLVELEDLAKIAKEIEGAKAYYMQQFMPISTIDPGFLKVVPYPVERIIEARDNVRKLGLVKKCEARY